MLFRFLRSINTRSSVQLLSRSVTRKDLIIVKAFQNLRLLPFFSQRLLSTTAPRFEFIFYKLLSVDFEKFKNQRKFCKTQATLQNPLQTESRFFRRRWKWWRSEYPNECPNEPQCLTKETYMWNTGGGIKFRRGFSCQVPGSQRSNPSNSGKTHFSSILFRLMGSIKITCNLVSGWNVNEIHGKCGIQEIIWWRTFVGEIQKKPQEAVCPSDQGNLHQVKIVVGFPQKLVSPQARQNYHWKPLPDMQRRIFGLGLQVCILHLL